MKNRRSVFGPVTLETAGIAGAMAMAAAIGLLAVWRAGYSPDEEITYFVVQGIRTEGLPVLPSGIAYWRGPLYSYLAWLGGVLGGHDLAAYRIVSLSFAVSSVLLVAWLARSVVFSTGVVAALLMGAGPVSTATGAYARFYGPFVAMSVVALLLAARMQQDRRQQKWFLVACVLARGFHEFGMLLAVVPVASWLCAHTSAERRAAARLMLATAAVLLAEHAVLMALPCVARTCIGGAWGFSWAGLPAPVGAAIPVLGLATMADFVPLLLTMAIAGALVRRVTGVDWIFAIVAALAAALFATGVVIALVVVWAIARPAHASRVVMAGLGLACTGWIAWTVLALLRSDAEPNLTFALGLLGASVLYPWSGLQFFLSEQPVMSALVALGIVRSVLLSEESRSIVPRTMAIVLWVQLLSFGVVGLEVRARFMALLLPLVAVFASSAIEWLGQSLTTAVANPRLPRFLARVTPVATALALIGIVLVEQASAISPHRDELAVRGWWEKWTPPVALTSLTNGPARLVGASDLVITNDELAAVLLLGRSDYWWPPDETAAERYGYVDPAGVRRGMYAGAPVLADLDSVQRVIGARSTRGVVVLMFNTGKFGFDVTSLSTLSRINAKAEVAGLPGEWQLSRFPPVGAEKQRNQVQPAAP